MTQLVKALIVTDGSGGFRTTAAADAGAAAHFHLGEFVSVLSSTVWEGFTLQITKAHRGVGAGGFGGAVTAADVGADLIDFDFSAHDLAQYDMVLIFAIMPDGSQLVRTGDVVVSADATAAELAAITAFMQSGGGVFATGDHESLGAALCREIPRVRNMRRWYFGNAPTGVNEAPNGSDATRLDTLRSGFDATFQFDDQSDTIAQEIIPAMHYSRWGRWLRVGYPHPLLCSPQGIVRHLPDHPHEGRCEVPQNLGLTTLGVEEYPVHSGGARLAPEVVADATVIGGHSTGSKPPVDEARFGVIGAWDGHLVDKGRVVVDATWHHFFNINLSGDVGSGDANKQLGFYGPRLPGQPDHYASIKWYYRNIVYWLVPKRRVEYTLREAILVAAHRGPMFEEFPRWREGGFHGPFDWHFVWDVAQITKAYFDRARGGCFWLQIIPIVLEPLPHWRKWWEELAPLLDPWRPPIDRKRQRVWADARMAGEATVILDAVIGAHTLAVIEAGARVGARGGEKFDRATIELFDKYMEASLAEAAKAISETRADLLSVRNALKGPAR